MIQLLFVIPFLDAAGNIIQTDPPTITPNFIECISSATYSKNLSRQLMVLIAAHLAEKDRKSRDFILRIDDPPSINHLFMSYFISAYFPSLFPSKIMDTLKSTFILFSWTPPPLSTDKYYQLHLRNYSDNAVDHMLEQPETK